MNWEQWSEAWRLLGYIEDANDTIGEDPGHDEIQEAVNALADILREIKPEAGKK